MLAVVSNDRRAFIEISKIKPAGTLPLNGMIEGLTTEALTRFVSAWTGHLTRSAACVSADAEPVSASVDGELTAQRRRPRRRLPFRSFFRVRVANLER